MDAIFLCVELALNGSPEDLKAVLDAVEIYLESAEEKDQLRVHLCLGKVLEKHGLKHPLFRSLLANSKKVMLSLYRYFH